MDYTNSIKDYIALEIETLKKLNVEDINKAMNLMDDTRKAGGTIFVFGTVEVPQPHHIIKMTSIKV